MHISRPIDHPAHPALEDAYLIQIKGYISAITRG